MVIIRRAKEAISCCLFLFLNWKTANSESKADNKMHNLEYEKWSFNKKLDVSFCKTGKLYIIAIEHMHEKIKKRDWTLWIIVLNIFSKFN